MLIIVRRAVAEPMFQRISVYCGETHFVTKQKKTQMILTGTQQNIYTICTSKHSPILILIMAALRFCFKNVTI